MYSRKIRLATVAGKFYERIPSLLKKNIKNYLAETSKNDFFPETAIAQALIVPHAGYSFSGKTAAKTFSTATLNTNYKRIIIIAPSHYVGFSGLALPSYEACSTPLGEVSVDTKAINKLSNKNFVENDNAHAHEHSLEVVLPFIQTLFPKVPVMPLVCGHINVETAREIAKTLLPFWNSETLWVISSDFTHYGHQFGYIPFTDDIPENLKNLDLGAIDRILKFNLNGFDAYLRETGATICGQNPIMIMLAVAELAKNENTIHYKAKLIEYTTSGELTGDYNHTVSYAGIAVYTEDISKINAEGKELREYNMQNNDDYTEKQKSEILLFVKKTIRSKLKKNQNITVKPTPEYLKEERSCFVTLHNEDGSLRGCIGHIMPFEPLYNNLKRNALNAAFQDTRFSPVKSLEEFSTLNIEVSILTPTKKVESYNDIIIGEHGIILKNGNRNAVFLPQVAPEQGWDIQTTLMHLSMKAGLSSDAWESSNTQFEVFRAIVFGDRAPCVQVKPCPT